MTDEMFQYTDESLTKEHLAALFSFRQNTGLFLQVGSSACPEAFFQQDGRLDGNLLWPRSVYGLGCCPIAESCSHAYGMCGLRRMTRIQKRSSV